jgi:hypothetical protein
MAGQNIKVNYKTTHPDATDVSTPEERHAARRELNMKLREEQKLKPQPKSQPKPPSMGQTTAQLFSGKNIVETGKSAIRTGHAGIQNVGSRVASLSASAPPVSFTGGGIIPAWTVGAKMPAQYMRMPGAQIESTRSKSKKKKHHKETPASTRPEWIRF